MERSERSSSGKPTASPSAPSRAPGRSPASGEGAAPPLDPDDDQPDEADEKDALDAGEERDAPASIRAEPWEPDACLMRALGLELEELRARVEAGERDSSDDPPLRPVLPRPKLATATPAARPACSSDDEASDDEASDDEASEPADPEAADMTTPSDGRPPWW